MAALERAAEGLHAETAVHIRYGYGIEANNKWKETLGAEWRQYEESFQLLQQSLDRHRLARVHPLPRSPRARQAHPGGIGYRTLSRASQATRMGSNAESPVKSESRPTTTG